MKTLSVGLTGTIGSGKSLVAQIFAHLHIPVYNADSRAKMFYDNKNVLKDMQSMFGTDIVINNILNKELLADKVFNDKKELKKLTGYIHPMVKKDYLFWLEQQHTHYAIMESAIIFETGWDNLFDRIICVNTPMSLILKRTALRDKQPIEKVKERLQNQMQCNEKINRSDYLVTNDDVQLVLPQVIEIHKKLSDLANKKIN